MCSADPGVSVCFIADVDDIFDVLLGDRVEADNPTVEGLVEVEVLLLRALHIHNVDRVVVRRYKFVRLVLDVWVLVQGLTSVK